MLTANWIVPVNADVAAYLDQAVVGASANLTANDSAQAALTALMTNMVLQVRAAIGTGNRTPLSGTAGSIPPESKDYLLVMVAGRLMGRIPSMAAWAGSDEFKAQRKCATEWLEKVQAGELSVTWPSNPDQTTMTFGVRTGGSIATDMTVNDIPPSTFNNPVPVPFAPANLLGTAALGMILLKWDLSNELSTYTVSRGVSSGAETVLASGIAAATYLDTTVTSGVTYYYTVKAVNSYGTSGVSQEISVVAA